MQPAAPSMFEHVKDVVSGDAAEESSSRVV
jgi:hypothetical protein